MADLEWPGAVSPIDCPPEAHITSGIGFVLYRVPFGFEIQEPEWSGWDSHVPCGIRSCSYRVAFGFQMPQLECSRAIPRFIGPNQSKRKNQSIPNEQLLKAMKMNNKY